MSPHADLRDPIAESNASSGLGFLLAVIGLIAYAIVFALVFPAAGYSLGGALLVGPILFAISLPILIREGRRQGNRNLVVFLSIVLILKLLMIYPRFYFAADSIVYYKTGLTVAAGLRHGQGTGLKSLTGSNFPAFVCGIVMAVIGPTRLGASLVFSWLSFWGTFLLYKAFLIGVPEGRERSYRWLVFLLPSMLFWPAEVGKESWMLFAMGIAAMGAALLYTRQLLPGVALAALGLWFELMVRPPVAGLTILAIAAGLLVLKPSPKMLHLGVLAKMLGMVAMVFLTVYFAKRATSFVQSTIGDQKLNGVQETFRAVTARTVGGGSDFRAASVVANPLNAPKATLTVLFRPLIIEAHNAQALVAAAEATIILMISIIRFRWILAAVGSIRRQPYVAFAIAYTAVFIVAFSSFANFGILVRERIQLYPIYFVLLTIPPWEKRIPKADPVLAGPEFERVGSRVNGYG